MKRRLNKLFAAFLAVMLLVSCLSLTALADDTTYYTASNGHSYDLYQIFTGTQDSSGTLVNLQWGYSGKKVTDHTGHTKDSTDVDYTKADVTAVCMGVTEALKAVSNSSDADKLAVIKQFVDFDKPFKSAKNENSQPVESKADGSNALKYEGLDAGYYLIKDTDTTQDKTGGLYTLYVVKVTNTGTLLFEPKGQVPTITKQVKDEEGNWNTNNSASMGETVEFRLTATVNSRIADYGQYYMKINDTLSKGLETNDTDKNVKVVMKTPVTTTQKDGAEDKEVTTTYYYDVTKYFYSSVGTKDSENGTTPFVVAIQDLLALRKATDITYTADMGDSLKDTVAKTIEINGNTEIIVTYNAKLTTDAVVIDPNTNTVNLDYYNNPNDSGEGAKDPPDTPKDEPTPKYPKGETVNSTTETYTTSLSITKENDDGEVLTGAVFTLSGDNVYKLVITDTVFTVDENGDYWKLKSGLYTTEKPTDETDTKDYEDVNTTYSKSYTTETKSVESGKNSISAEVDENGMVTFTGLGEGTYTLTETQTPAGYNTMDKITFKISYDESTKTFSTNRNDLPCTDGKTIKAVILNHAGGSLPHTGGIGTTIFYVVGTILVLSAGILLITKKRMGREQN
jgi:fimbrial isopeptide formation D2 family protein/LPXTG-motif cell wall-anchored protein